MAQSTPDKANRDPGPLYRAGPSLARARVFRNMRRKTDPRNPLMPIDAPETQIVTSWKVACDGGEGALGHPRVWLTIPQDTGWVECGYCDKRYEIDRAHAHDDH